MADIKGVTVHYNAPCSGTSITAGSATIGTYINYSSHSGQQTNTIKTDSKNNSVNTTNNLTNNNTTQAKNAYNTGVNTGDSSGNINGDVQSS